MFPSPSPFLSIFSRTSISIYLAYICPCLSIHHLLHSPLGYLSIYLSVSVRPQPAHKSCEDFSVWSGHRWSLLGGHCIIATSLFSTLLIHPPPPSPSSPTPHSIPSISPAPCTFLSLSSHLFPMSVWIFFCISSFLLSSLKLSAQISLHSLLYTASPDTAPP